MTSEEKLDALAECGLKLRKQFAVPDLVESWGREALDEPGWDLALVCLGMTEEKGPHQAVAKAQEYQQEGDRWVVDMDLEKFFDRVNHDRLMARLAKRIDGKVLLKLIRAFLTSGVLDNGLVEATSEGTPQGGPLSPLLSNIVLDELDRELERRHRFVRYADDCNIYVRSRKAAERALVSVTRFVERRLRLKVNREKSAVDRPWRRTFLGFSFTVHRTPKRRIAPAAVERFKQKIRELTRRTRGGSLEEVIGRLGSYLRGWLGYFGLCQTRNVLRDLESWLHRRLRSLMWKRWKRGKVRYAELRKRGVAATWPPNPRGARTACGASAAARPSAPRCPPNSGCPWACPRS